MQGSQPSANTPIFQLTVGEFLDLLKNGQTAPPLAQQPEFVSKNHIYGIDGLARLLGCSYPTAHRLKASGKIPFTQVGRKIVFDETAVLAALSKSASN